MNLRTLQRLALSLALLCGCATASLSVAAPSEYRLKAVFLFNFSQFVEWPPAAFAASDGPFGICVLGNDPFGVDLDQVVRGELVSGRPMIVRRIASSEEYREAGPNACQILFVSAEAGAREVELLKAISRDPVLTVGDAGARAQPRVMIGFLQDQQRIRLRIDAKAARSAGLTVSSKLLRLGS